MARELSQTQRRIARRHFIGGGAVVLALAGTGLAACGDNGGGTAGPAQDATPTPAGLGGFAPIPKPQGTVASARDATLPPLEPSPRQLTYRVLDSTVEIAAGVQYNAWTFEGTVPGPVLHVKQGDTVQFTLTNEAASGHSIDFHAARTPWDKNYITIAPGDSISFDWTADFPGVYVYHCGTAPVLHHIANGMYGVIIVDPETPLPPAREYWLMQSEFYAKPAEDGTWDGDIDKMLAPRPDILAFNGVAFQYRDNPLQASAGEKIRLYVATSAPPCSRPSTSSARCSMSSTSMATLPTPWSVFRPTRSRRAAAPSAN